MTDFVVLISIEIHVVREEKLTIHFYSRQKTVVVARTLFF